MFLKGQTPRAVPRGRCECRSVAGEQGWQGPARQASLGVSGRTESRPRRGPLALDRPLFFQEGLPFGDLCPPGHFCPAGTEDPRRWPCPAGTWNAEKGAPDVSWCLPCPPGLFCAAAGQAVPGGPCAPGECPLVPRHPGGKSARQKVSRPAAPLPACLPASALGQGPLEPGVQLSVARLGRHRREAGWRPLVGPLDVMEGP